MARMGKRVLRLGFGGDCLSDLDFPRSAKDAMDATQEGNPTLVTKEKSKGSSISDFER